MTIAVSLKVHEGVVLAADSASSLVTQGDSTFNVVNVYDNANKIVNLVKGLPIGVITWGAGSIGPESITSILKDLRLVLTGQKPPPSDAAWRIDVNTYTVEAVANLVRSYVYNHHYEKALGGHPDAPALGLIVAGYSAQGGHAEEYKIEMDSTGCGDPLLLRSEALCGVTSGGQPQAITRLLLGFDPAIGAVMEKALGVPQDQVGPALQILQEHLTLPLVQDPMPFQDALDLAEFLVDVTIRLTRFMPGPSTVGGPIELAGITKHEGFKWIKRKHYYQVALNHAGGLTP